MPVRLCKGDEVVDIGSLERHIHGVQSERGKPRVVHDRRERVGDGIADDAVEGGVGSDPAKPEFVHQACGRHLPGRYTVARVGPPVPQPRGQDARRYAGLPHREQHVPVHFVRRRKSRVLRQVDQRARVREPLSCDGDLRSLRRRSTASPRPARRRSAGTSSNACIERTTPRPRRLRTTAGTNSARASTSMYSAPAACASVSSRSRSSSDPLNPPPSHDARHVTMTGRRRPSTAPSASGARPSRDGLRRDRRGRRRHVRGAALPSSVRSRSRIPGARAWAPKRKSLLSRG